MGKELCHPTVWVDPTPEEVQEAQRVCEENMKERDARWEASSAEDFEKWKQNEIAAGRRIEVVPDLEPFEPPRLNRIEHWVKHQVGKSQTKVFHDFDLNVLRKRNPKVKERNPLISTELSSVGSTTHFDKNGGFVLHIQKNGTKEAYRGMPGSQQLERKVAAAYDKLQQVFPATVLISKDPRHPRNDPYHKAEAEYYHGNNLPYGVFHDGVWHEQGHGTDQINWNGGPWCHKRSDDNCGGLDRSEVKEKAMAEFRRVVVGVEVSAGMILKALEPKYFETASAHLDKFVDCGLAVRYSPWQWSLLLGMPVNKSAEAHKDGGDASEAIVATMPIGRWSEGDYCVPSLGIRLQVLEGDIVFTKAALVEHAVTAFRGQRLCLVFTSKSDKTSIRQHINYMTEPVEIKTVWAKKRALEARKEAKHTALAAKEAVLVKDWLATATFDYENFPTIDDYKILELSKFPKRLHKAAAFKKSRILALKRQATTPENAARIESLSKRPASLFYELMPLEQRRVDYGKNPFQFMTVREKKTAKLSQGPWHQRRRFVATGESREGDDGSETDGSLEIDEIVKNGAEVV